MSTHPASKNTTLIGCVIRQAELTGRVPVREYVSLLLAFHSHSIASAARAAGVTPSAAYRDINGGKACRRFRTHVARMFGGVPWA